MALWFPSSLRYIANTSPSQLVADLSKSHKHKTTQHQQRNLTVATHPATSLKQVPIREKTSQRITIAILPDQGRKQDIGWTESKKNTMCLQLMLKGRQEEIEASGPSTKAVFACSNKGLIHLFTFCCCCCCWRHHFKTERSLVLLPWMGELAWRNSPSQFTLFLLSTFAQSACLTDDYHLDFLDPVAPRYQATHGILFWSVSNYSGQVSSRDTLL
jgi:hypothetical protein